MQVKDLPYLFTPFTVVTVADKSISSHLLVSLEEWIIHLCQLVDREGNKRGHLEKMCKRAQLKDRTRGF